MASSDDEDLWIGTLRGLMRLHGGRLTVEPVPQELQERAISALAAGPGGHLWLSMQGRGIQRREQGTWSPVPTLPDPADIMTLGADGALWILYRDDRILVRLENERIQRFTLAAGPNIGIVHVIYAGERGSAVRRRIRSRKP